MVAANLEERSGVKGHDVSSGHCDDHSNRQTLEQALKHVHAIVPPLWPLADYVAVNPCVGLTDRPFLDAWQILRDVRDCDLVMPLRYFQGLLAENRLTTSDLQTAHSQCLSEYPEWYREFDLVELKAWLKNPESWKVDGVFRYRTVAEAIDQRLGSTWTSHIVNDITRHCAAHLDEGQAAWSNPWAGETLYSAWREASQLSRRMDLLGLPGFCELVSELPATPEEAVHHLLNKLAVPPDHWREFLLCEVFSVYGWGSFIRYRVREAEFAGLANDDLTGLVAIRLAYDVALAQSVDTSGPLLLYPADAGRKDDAAPPPTPPSDVLGRYALQVATEQVYRRELLQKLATRSAEPPQTTRRILQMVFCIDVRSEVFRRNLESVDSSIETFGFAGFFGLPLEYVSIGQSQGTPHCPVLLQPGFQVHEKLRGISDATEADVIQKRSNARLSRKLWKLFQSSASSCFSFVESLGLPYIAKLLSNSFCWTKPVASSADDGLSHGLRSHLGPDIHADHIHADHNHGLDAARRIDLAEGMLRNLGLTDGFARLVILCGHASDVTNNPYRAGLDCGACGGHSGEPNARVAAALLNDPDVRSALTTRGIIIPEETWFLGAVHNTTVDKIDLCDLHVVPATHCGDIAQVEEWFQRAGHLCRSERSSQFGSATGDELFRRSADWSEVRPEWGLARNASFIVAPRSRTTGLNLEGRAFMHSYDYHQDPELKVLELIMTAPMVVTNWINMQYYSSTVDPVAFGSGNKVIHNVVGQFGVLLGNGGDLMTGLPWQSVHDGRKYYHEPLRLLVVINAPRSSIQQIIDKHALVKDLVTNGWLTLIAWEEDQFYHWTPQCHWDLQAA
ncbi:MAG: DUF2309 domain-containing protein [Planctomycetaceae bacterium]